MNIQYFNKIKGNYVEEIRGQSRFAYAISETDDFYDVIEYSKQGGYPGVELYFYDYDNGEVEMPFERKQNVCYGNPVCIDNELYFLQGDFNKNKITLFKYFPKQLLEVVTEFEADKMELYNLRIVGENVHVISQKDTFICYYPKHIEFSIKANESVQLIDDEKVYLEAWIEEGWDETNNCATKEYKYYTKIIIKDYMGNFLSEEIGGFHQAFDGKWWIA